MVKIKRVIQGPRNKNKANIKFQKKWKIITDICNPR